MRTVLRPACLSDVFPLLDKYQRLVNLPVAGRLQIMDKYRLRHAGLVWLYQAEWEKRGFKRSP